MNNKRKLVIQNNEISVIKTYKLGGFDQKVLIEGKTRALPIVITLHGGPGSPIPFCVGARGLFPEFTEKCMLVSWDQYGCGINNAELSDEFSIENLVDMTKDLVISLKREFESNKIYLFAMSWGSVLSAKVASECPDLIDGVIVYGQMLRNLLRSDDAVEALIASKASIKLKEKMEKTLKKDSQTYQEAMSISQWIRRYTQGYQNKNEPKAAVGRLITGILSSPDYRFRDFVAILINGYLKNRSIMRELSELDLSDTLARIAVPYHIIQGDTDIVTSTKEIVNFVNECDNDYIKINVIKNAAHIPGTNGMDAVMRMINKLCEV